MAISAEPQRQQQRSTPDLVVTVLLLLVGALAAAAAVPLGAVLTTAAGGCGVQGPCSTLGLTAGVGLAALGPSAGVLGFGAWAVVRLVRGRRAWWVALVALLSAPALWFLGAFVLWVGVGGLSA
ncbi:hypothetical protein F1641_08400 [Quadrisphaera sp. INWT6]|nr:hypothetical protein [Quadrisphaera sp. INWT6]